MESVERGSIYVEASIGKKVDPYKPPIVAVDKDGMLEPRALFVILDWDGTRNPEKAPEEEKFGQKSFGQSRSVLRQLDGLPMGGGYLRVITCSGRTTSELRRISQQEGLGIPWGKDQADSTLVHADTLEMGEDGNVVRLPSYLASDEFLLKRLEERGLKTVYLQEDDVVILEKHALTTIEIQDVLLEAKRRLRQNFGEEYRFITTLDEIDAVASVIQKHVGHPTIDISRDSALRATSAFVLIDPREDIANTEIAVIQDIASRASMRTARGHTDILEIHGRDANKALGLKIMDVVSKEIWGIPPVFAVFANGKNDIPLLNAAIESGGLAVVVPNEGSYLIERNEVPEETIFATAPNIHGVAQHIPTVIRWASKKIVNPAPTTLRSGH